MYLRRARPTRRLLDEDLGHNWGSVEQIRSFKEGGVDYLHPLSEISHPIISKALSCFGDNPENDNFVGPIQSVKELHLKEIKSSNWRGGVWHDEDNDVEWLLVAGIAKGNHEDFDDFYERIRRESSNYSRWLPTEDDIFLLKRERAAEAFSRWELAIQEKVLENLQKVHSGGTEKFSLPSPKSNNEPFASVLLIVEQNHSDETPCDDIYLEITPDYRYATEKLLWAMNLRILTTLDPPEQGWDTYGNTFSTIVDPGSLSVRIDELKQIVSEGRLAESTPGQHSHYTHRTHIAGSAVNGKAIRAMCGAFFVQSQHPDNLPECPKCSELWESLPKG